jgi:two-component system NtrC family sensor kinase
MHSGAVTPRKVIVPEGHNVSLRRRLFDHVSKPEEHSGDVHRRLVDRFPAPALEELEEEDALQLLERWRLAAVGQLAAGLAHEINNPLFAILGTVEFMLEDAPPGSELRERLERIERSGLEIREAVRALVSFAREPAADRRLLSLQAVCADAVQLARRATLAKDVDIHERYPPAAVEVEASPNQVKQILLVLIVNGQQAQPQGGEIRLEVERSGVEALVRVHDRGPGLDEELSVRVFEPFFTTRRAEGASGLGLTVARSLARLQGGEIDLDTTPGRGSTFTLRLPVAA